MKTQQQIFRRAVEDFDRLKTLRHKMPKQPPSVSNSRNLKTSSASKNSTGYSPTVGTSSKRNPTGLYQTNPMRGVPNEANAVGTSSSETASAQPNESTATPAARPS